MRLRHLLATTTLALGCLPSVAGAARPHDTVVTYLHSGVHVTRLQMDVRRVDHVLRAHVRMTATADHATTRYLRVGRCTGGATLALPTCPATATLAVHIPAGTTTDLERTLTLRQPPPKVDALLAELGPRHRSRGVRGVNARLLLRGEAWRGATAAQTYGAQLDGAHVRRLQLDLARISAAEGRLSLVWNGPDAPSTATTTLRRCTTTCRDTPLRSERGRTGPQRFAVRPWLAAVTRLGFSVANGQQQLATAQLPWPR